MRRTYIETFTPNFFVPDTSTVETTTRDPEVARHQVGESVYAFRFFDRVESEIDGVSVRSDPVNYSPFYYVPPATILSINDVERPSVLHDNMCRNGLERVVRTRYGQTFPVKDGDRVLT